MGNVREVHQKHDPTHNQVQNHTKCRTEEQWLVVQRPCLIRRLLNRCLHPFGYIVSIVVLGAVISIIFTKVLHNSATSSVTSVAGLGFISLALLPTLMKHFYFPQIYILGKHFRVPSKIDNNVLDAYKKEWSPDKYTRDDLKNASIFLQARLQQFDVSVTGSITVGITALGAVFGIIITGFSALKTDKDQPAGNEFFLGVVLWLSAALLIIALLVLAELQLDSIQKQHMVACLEIINDTLHREPSYDTAQRVKRITIHGVVETNRSRDEWLTDFIEWLQSRGEHFGSEVRDGTEQTDR